MMAALTGSNLVQLRYDLASGDSIRAVSTLVQVGARKTYLVKVRRGIDGFLIATVPELEGVVTQAKSEDDLIRNVLEAMGLMLEDSGENKEFNIYLDTKDSE